MTQSTMSNNPNGDEPLIYAEDLHHSFDDVTVLDGVDLTVEAGEFVALVGPNGAGKTTLLRMINGILDPDEGTVALDGESTSDLASKAISRRVATVPQDTHLGFSFSAEQIVEMGRTPHRSRLDWSDDSDPVEAALERTETTHLRDRSVDDLSGGERQRVLLARALAQEPAALLLDEPTASLDINHQVQVLELVEDLVGEGRGAVAAIHDLDLAARYCDRLVLLADGEIRANGKPATVLTDDALEEAFGATTTVTRNPATGKPTIAAFTERPQVDGQIHLAGGGLSAQRALATLWRAGYDVTLGPVPEGDAVLQSAQQFDCKFVAVPPFQSLDAHHAREAFELARQADVLVTSPGAGSDGITTELETVPQVFAAFGEQPRIDSETQVPARGDGGVPGFSDSAGDSRVVETENELLAVVAELLESE